MRVYTFIFLVLFSVGSFGQVSINDDGSPAALNFCMKDGSTVLFRLETNAGWPKTSKQSTGSTISKPMDFL